MHSKLLRDEIKYIDSLLQCNNQGARLALFPHTTLARREICRVGLLAESMNRWNAQ
ncbi:MAG: hypothetical protein ABW220_09535 [Burkholderiaceae bacterium]